MDQLISSDPRHIGPYRLIARLGAGGMGVVYLGRSAAGRTVAVKVVQAEHAQHPEFRRRFAREVSAARRVGGSWTAGVLDADTEAAVPWVATQYIPGPDLGTVVAEDFGPLPEHSVSVLANRLALALQAVHEAGLIHRDLKPSNVLVTVDGPRVIDFGIARAMDSLTGDSLHTRTGMLIGSPGFMSPEQVRGLALTPASDVFCLGAVLVYAATGRLLFGATETGLNAHLFRIAEDEADLTGVPEPLLDLVRACLDKDPAGRPTPQEIAARTASDTEAEWLPGRVLAQLGRHAAKLLDYTPDTTAHAPGSAPDRMPTPPTDPQVVAGGPRPATPPPPAHAPAPTARLESPPGPAGIAPTRPQSLPPPHPLRWSGLVVAAFVQLLVLFETGSLSAAGPFFLEELHLPFGDANRLYLWYDVAFGAVLLLGGHLVDLVGRRRVLLIGLSGLVAAAAIGGAAPSGGVLLLAFIAQGGLAGLLTPAVLALVSADFTGGKARGTAFGVYLAVAVGGSTLSDFVAGDMVFRLGWRVCLYVGVALAVIAVIGVATSVSDHPARTGARLDLPGLLLGSGGIGMIAYGFGGGSLNGYSVTVVLVLVAVGVALLLVFAWWQTQAAAPLLPPYILKDRTRVGSVVALLLSGVGTVVLGSALMQYLEYFHGYNPIEAALAMLPTAAAVVLGATQVSARLLHRLSPRMLVVPGLILAAFGLFLLTGLQDGSGYAALCLPSMLLTGFGLGVAGTPLFSLASDGVGAPDSGGGAAVTSAAHRGGWLLGVALLSYLDWREPDSYAVILGWAAGTMLVAAMAAALLLRPTGRQAPGSLR